MAEFIKADMVKPGATVIDFGVNRVDDPAAEKGYRLVGRRGFYRRAADWGQNHPEPRRRGPMTIAMLMRKPFAPPCSKPVLASSRFKKECKPPEYSPTCNALCCAKTCGRRSPVTSSRWASSAPFECLSCRLLPPNCACSPAGSLALGEFHENIRLIGPGQETVVRKCETKFILKIRRIMRLTSRCSLEPSSRSPGCTRSR
ncbi:MAG: hypothetical protein Ct9H300mP32_3860 [Verrucomicrobiota bacterium]|nr:MAG: hypothetical protein Ct9H300mP32_3860 [Verrucomicrobiota bacterium]